MSIPLNIFYVDADPVRAARDLADQHATKMVLESVQLLASAHHLSGTATPDLPKLTHRNHPCAKWVRSSIHHYRWLARHAVALAEEFERRYGHPHSWAGLATFLATNEPPLSKASFVEPPQAMPEHCRVDGDCVAAYRKYYKDEKSRFARWMHSPLPEWW